MLPALSERPSEERRTGAGVVGNDFTQRRGTGIHGDHTVRAETRSETGLLLLSRHHCTAEPVQGDFFVERGLPDRIAHCIVSGTHSWKPPAGGRLILLGKTIDTAGRLKAAQDLSRAQASLTNAWAKTKNTTEARSVATESRKNSALLGAGGMCVGAAAAPLKKQETRGASRRPERDSRRKHTRPRRQMQGAAILCWRLTKRIKKPAKRIKDTPK